MKFNKVGVLYGGDSSEREISLLSGQAIFEALIAKGLVCELFDPAVTPIYKLLDKAIDAAFIALHGGIGEDGSIQSTLDLMGIPYTGSKYKACVISHDKILSKWMWQASGLPVARSVVVRDLSHLVSCQALGFPLFLKPPCEGSSVDVHKIRDEKELISIAQRLLLKYPCLLAEEFLDGGEYSCSILGQKALPLVKIEPNSEFYDYKAKYLQDETVYYCPAGLTIKEEEEARSLALSAFLVCGCQGWGRVDLIRDRQGCFYILELNAVPGMTSHSLVPMAARENGLSFEDLCLTILNYAN